MTNSATAGLYLDDSSMLTVDEVNPKRNRDLYVRCDAFTAIMSPQFAAALAEKLNAHFAQLAKEEGLTQARAIAETMK